MTEHRVGDRSELRPGDRHIIGVGDREVGVFVLDSDEIVAYENVCPHQGGPVCEGVRLGRVIAEVDDARRVRGHHFAVDEPHIACPWHGWEFNLRTGTCPLDPERRLRPCAVVEREDTIYVVV